MPPLSEYVHIRNPDGTRRAIKGTCLRCVEYRRVALDMHAMMVKKIEDDMVTVQLHGLQRTGTNWLKLLLEENFKIRVLTSLAGSKHEHYIAPRLIDRELPVIIMTKNPWAWLTSMYRQVKCVPYYRQATGFDDFLHGPFIFPSTNALVWSPNPIQHYNAMHYNWLQIQLETNKKFILRYEDVYEKTEEMLTQIAGNVGAERKNSDELFNPDMRVGPMAEATSRDVSLTANKFDRSYYDDEKYFKEFSEDQMAFVNREVNPDVLKALGYGVGAG